MGSRVKQIEDEKQRTLVRRKSSEAFSLVDRLRIMLVRKIQGNFSRERLKLPGEFLVSWMVSLATLLVVYRDLLIFNRISHLRYQDSEVDQMAFFTFLSNLYQGGVKLWNSYDAVSLMLHYFAGGLYSVQHFFSALGYEIIKLFTDSPAEAFHITASTVPFLVSHFLVVLGSFFLVKRFTSSLYVLILMVTLSSTMFTNPVYFGANGRHLIYFYPLIFHSVLILFERFRFFDLCALALLFTVLSASSPFFGPGYFYQGAHYFVLACLVYGVLNTKDLWGKIKSGFLRSANYKAGIFTIIMCVIIIGPLAYYMMSEFGSYAMGKESGRLSDPLSFSAYFSRPVDYVERAEFLLHQIDFSRHDRWWFRWQFVGYACILLSSLGLFFSKDRRKYIFMFSILMLWLLNSPRVANSLWDMMGSMAHFINALTNPGKALTRSMHQPAAFSIPFLMLPLMTMGIEYVRTSKSYFKTGLFFRSVLFTATVALTGHLLLFNKIADTGQVANLILSYLLLGMGAILLSSSQNKDQWIGRSFLILYLLLYAGVAAFFIKDFGSVQAKYGVLLLVVSSFTLLLLPALPDLKWISKGKIALAVFGVMIASDFAGFYGNIDQWFGLVYQKPLPIGSVAGGRDIILDYQNPEIMPYHTRFRIEGIGQIPHAVTVNSFNQQGVFFRNNNYSKFLQTLKDMDTSRHKSLVPAFYEPMPQYLTQNTAMVFTADSAVLPGDGVMNGIVAKNLSQTVVMVDDQVLGGRYIDKLPEELTGTKADLAPENRIYEFEVSESEGILNDDLVFYSVELPRDFPAYYSTNVFLSDNSQVQFSLNGQSYSQVQGYLQPLTFDINNYQEGFLTFVLDKNRKIGEKIQGKLIYPANMLYGLKEIKKYNNDELEFTYHSDRDGWLIFHYPFDKRWNLTIDGLKKPLVKANVSFMASPVTKGIHSIKLEYWPETNLRVWLAISYLFMIGMLLSLTGYFVRSFEKVRHEDGLAKQRD